MEGGADVHVDSRYGWPNTQAATVHVSGTLRGTSHCTVPGIQEAAWRQLLPLLQLLQQRLLGGGGVRTVAGSAQDTAAAQPAHLRA